jgi:hypothetical protein
MRRRHTKFSATMRGAAFAVAISTGAVLSSVSIVHADDAHARVLFKEMSRYLAAQKSISFDYDSSIEAVSASFQKLSFTSSGTVRLDRPDKIRVTRKGGFADVEMVFDGKTLTALGKNKGIFVKTDMPGSIDEMIDNVRLNSGFSAPGADLLLSNVYDTLIPDVVEAIDLGTGVVRGVTCDHLAFRNEMVDWELWVAEGAKPYPCKYVVTSKLTVQAPQYSVEISGWKTGSEVSDDDFAFKNSTGAKEVKIDDFVGMDEMPDPSIEGDAQ